jgi:hypothetical protein
VEGAVRELPTGTVTFLFSDIEGSTRQRPTRPVPPIRKGLRSGGYATDAAVVRGASRALGPQLGALDATAPGTTVSDAALVSYRLGNVP